MRGNILIGIDVGGTHTDGVAVDAVSGTVQKKLKVATKTDLVACIQDALSALLEGLDPSQVRRVALSTTLVTNAVVTGKLEPVGMILMAGPGLDASKLSDDPNCRLISGAIDHRGREIVPVDRGQLDGVLSSFAIKGITTVGVSGKFSVRNPDHELLVLKEADKLFDHVACSHHLSGSLNFPRRATTAWLSAGVWRRHINFITSAKKTAEKLACTAPLFLLRADGGAQLAETFTNAAEAALSGPAASIMGIAAVADIKEESIGLDIGGTTTDISFFVHSAPLVEHQGATIGEYLTQIRALYNRSIAVGGDSAVNVFHGRLKIGPNRAGPPYCKGGPKPTPTDALVALGYADGDRAKALEAMEQIAWDLGMEPADAPKAILSVFSTMISDAAFKYLEEVNRLPVYTLHELLEGHKVTPRKVLLVGGPAKGLKQWIAEAFALPVEVPAHYEVANAVGAAVASLNTELHATADTGAGWLTMSEAGIKRAVPQNYTCNEMIAEAKAELVALAVRLGAVEASLAIDVAEKESFNIIEGYDNVGSIHRLRVQVRPSILCRVGGER